MSSRRVHGRHPLLPRGGSALDHDAPDAASALRLAASWSGVAPPPPLGPLRVAVRDRHVTVALETLPEHRSAGAEWLDAVDAGGSEPEPPIVDPALRACLAAIAGCGRPHFFDEHGATVGVGRRSRTWSWDELPFPPQTDLSGRHAPVVTVTGTNGKTTTAVLLAAIAWADGWLPGLATSAGIRIGRRWEERGDWSGAGAARRVVRDDEVNFAVLETARGGILRRGALVEGTHVAVLTNVSADHLGDGGVDTVSGLAEVKAVTVRALGPGGAVVVNRDDGELAAALAPILRDRPDLRVLGFSGHGRADGWWDGRSLRLPGLVLPAAEVPLSLDGRAVHNVENALAAALAAHACGIGPEAIREGLAAVTPTPEDSPGRANVFEVRGATALLEYAHNPDALRRLRELSGRWPARRRALLLGQAGDRPEALVRELAGVAAQLGADRYFLKPLPGYARGRDPAEVVAWLREGLLAAGIPAARIREVRSEGDGLAAAIGWAAPGDLLLLLVHEDPAAAVDLLRAAQR